MKNYHTISNNFHDSQIAFEKIIVKNYNIEPETLREKEMFVRSFFIGDGSFGIFKYKSGVYFSGHLNNLDFKLIQKLQRFCKVIWTDKNFEKYDIRETSDMYRISSSEKKLVLKFDKLSSKDKKKKKSL